MEHKQLLWISTLLVCCVFQCSPKTNSFKVFWNIPTFMCKKYNITFEKAREQYGIYQNHDDSFRGEEIAILYDPGNFPAILQNTTSKEYVYRNHGVPQEGDLSDHLTHFKEHVNELIPDPNFKGIGIIDFESWRPMFRQNFGTLKPYKILSMQIEQKAHPRWSKKQIEKEARQNFEVGAKAFMLETLKTAAKMRPNASWGYYAFPYCFNRDGNTPDKCGAGVKDENNMILWMFQSSGAIFPSVYLQERTTPSNRVSVVRGRVVEALRMANLVNGSKKPEVYAYHRYVYTDTQKYIDGVETFNVLNEVKSLGADGIVLWGSSFDVNTRTKCQEFETYFKEQLGPAVRMLNSD